MIKKWIFGEFIKTNKWKYVLGLAALIATSLLQLTLPKLLGFIIDALSSQSESQKQIFVLTLGMFGIAILMFGLKFIWRFFIMGRARDLECFLRAKLFAHLQSLPLQFFNNKKTGDLMAYAINDLNAIRQAAAFGVVFLIDGIIINLASFAVMIETISPLLTLFAVLPLLIAVFIILKAGNLIRSKFLEVQGAFSNISDKTQENIAGIRVVKAYVQENHEVEKMRKASLHRMKVQLNYVKLSAALGPLVQICFGISFSLVLVVGSSYVVNGTITLGDFIAFNSYLALLTMPVTHVGKIVEVWQRASASAKRLDEIFLTKTDIIDDVLTYTNTSFSGNIKIENLNFSYPGSKRKALKDINIEVEAGKTLAIVGRTGSGKTTLINLLLRLYKINRGKIFIDGMDINDISIAALRENIGCVPQDNFLFSTTIRENIGFFKKMNSDDEVEEAARMTSVYDNIIDFPDGFDTLVGERGITLSGGQKQRISIARAIIKEPSIMILDDSLSAVDTKTEEEILRNIKNILKGRTGIIIAHRISTIKHADEIVVMEKGMILERGNHEELLAAAGHYYKMYCAQIAECKLQEEVTL